MPGKIIYQIEFFSYWHAGSGLSGATYADNIVNKDENNLPYIPGKTVKGLLRDAAESIHAFDNKLVTMEFINDIFGVRTEEGNTNYKLEGKSFFTNATLSAQLAKNILDEALTNELYAVVASTSIDEYGQVETGSLRQLEVTIPITLYGYIDMYPDKYNDDQIIHCFDWIKQLGQNRNRGLGKCHFSIAKT